jgi:energy-coupling factor transporter ATP-binding protein EcfA2
MNLSLPATVLILSANPKGTATLRLDEEQREIKASLKRSRLRGHFDPITETAVRTGDLRLAMLEHQPQIVHFSGHGEGEAGLVFEDETGRAKAVSGEALAGLFALFAERRLQCVVLNACYSDVQAKAISRHIPYVIGMNAAIGDRAALEFAKGFYDALGAGESIAFAFEMGRNSIQMEGIPQDLIPTLMPNAEAISQFFSQSSAAESSGGSGLAQRSSNQQQVLRDVKEEVLVRRKQSLHHSAFIALKMEEQPDQVTGWHTEVKIGHKPSERLADHVTLADVFFREEMGGKLLVLGAPGSGKTTVLLDLAVALLSHAMATPSYPIPVILNLSSWQGTQRRGHHRKERLQSIPDWLVGELQLKYGIAPEIGKQWLKEKRLLPMLDGLDEVKPSEQTLCIKQINQWLQSDLRPLHLIVCSRVDEYQEQGAKLNLNGAVCLQSLTDEQIQQYLSLVHSELWLSLVQDPALLQLVQTPFMLSILTLAYEEISIDRWKSLKTTIDRCQYLLDAYIRRMLERDLGSGRSEQKQTRHWLVWLAKQLKEEFQDEFLIEHMQPTLLKSKAQQLLYTAIVSLIIGTVDGLLLGALFTPIVGLVVGVGVTLVLLSEQSVGAGGVRQIDVIESFQFVSGAKLLREVMRSIKPSLIFGAQVGFVIAGLRAITESLMLAEFMKSAWSGMIFGMIGGLNFGLINGLKADIETRQYPNQGIWNSLKNVIILTLISYPAALFLDRCFLLLFSQHTNGLLFIFRGFAWALIFGIGTGGKACVQHCVLRLLLYLDRSIPWNYAQFLQSCTERSLLQRVGGRFRFVHKQLQEHFAEMPFRS